MIKTNENLEMVLPKNQFKLFGYEYYFNSFINLYQKNRLPNAILLSGPKGSGKATFAYHFLHQIISQFINSIFLNYFQRIQNIAF